MHILYQTTCLVNGKKYIGVHNGTCDTYLGSGTAFKNAVKRYGRSNFVREVLFEFSTEEEAYAKEAEVVTEEIVQSKEYYNLILGGSKPPSPLGRKIKDTSAYSAASKKKWEDPQFKEKASANMKKNWNRSPERLEKLRTQNIGRTISNEHKSKLKEGRSKSAKVWKITRGEETWEMNLKDFANMVGSSHGSVNACVWQRKKWKDYHFS